MTNEEIDIAVARKLGIKPTAKWKDNKAVLTFIPNYCTDIQAAWEIISVLGIFDLRYRPHAERSWAIYMPEGDCEADTAPMAICLAFLKLEQ